MLTRSASNSCGDIAFKRSKIGDALLLIIFSAAVVFSFLNVCCFAVLKPFPYCFELIVFILFISTLFPKVSLLGLLFLLPVFGNKPSSPQALYLIITSSALILGVTLNLGVQKFIRKSFNNAKIISEVYCNPIFILSFLYILASVLSLSSLPGLKLFAELRSQIPDASGIVIIGQWYYFLTVIEDKLPYPILTALLSVQSFTIGCLFLFYVKTSSKLGFQTAITVVGSLLFSVVIGLCDYYQVLDLRILRQLDHVVNPNDIQFRLQSFFGHSGWYAEYIILAAPFILALFATKIPYSLKTTLVIVTLLLVQFALILSFQRGGWISMPITLVIIWAFVFVAYQHQRHGLIPIAALKKSILPITISLPLTVMFAVALIWFIVATGILKSDREIDFGSYVGRFSDIQRTNDRSSFVKAGALLGIRQPILGAGSESFCIQFDKEFTRSDGSYYKKFHLPLHGTAHNVFIQTFSGKGLVGLVLLLAILGVLLVTGFRAFKYFDGNFNSLLILVAGSCFAISFFIYGLVQEIFYIHSLQLLVFIVFGLLGGYYPKGEQISPRFLSVSLSVMLLLFIAHLFWVHAYPAHQRISERTSDHYGCYGREVNGHGEKYNWCSTNARQSVVVKGRKGQKYFILKIRTEFFKSGQETSNLRVDAAGETLYEATLAPHQTYSFKVSVPEKLYDQINSRHRLKINLTHNTYFIPQQIFKTGNDYRVLSFQLY